MPVILKQIMNMDLCMYISDNIETLILYSLPPYSACFSEP